MVKCYFCQEEILGTPSICNDCGQDYCQFHTKPDEHDCFLTRESLSPSPAHTEFVTPHYAQASPTSVSVSQSPRMQDYVNAQQSPSGDYQQSASSGGVVRGTTDGSFTWHHQEKMVPPNAFDPDSGIEFAGILLAHKSEALHLLIGCTLIYVIGLIGFYNEQTQAQLEALGYGWALFMLAGFYTTAFLFHEFGHRQVAKHYDLQTKFRLLTFGMILTAFSLITGLMAFFMGTLALPSLALPGAVVVLGLDKIDKRTGFCKAAGPTVNLVYGTILLVISLMMEAELYPLNMFIGVAASLNFMLGLFNMIPIGILDGQNILKWNKGVFFLLVATLGILIVFTYMSVYAPCLTNPYIPEALKIGCPPA